MKVYPTLEGPTATDYQQAEDELFPEIPEGQLIYTDEQRRSISGRARELFMERQVVN